ncbi:TetR/AcrR family transcriptional regulator [Actinomadura sp. 9N407]|uniref:TetR/AcrR family transcriptional regulator n=1 Tax=Actinomadura sp. 9N407 TaxID=3375154 RepID=UPI0037A7D26C
MAETASPARAEDAAPAAEGASVRDRLIAAAVQEFGEQGYDRARVQDIARRAGLTTGAIYGNFRNKAELLAEAVDSGLAAASRMVDRALNDGVGAARLLETIVTVAADPCQRAWAPLISEALAAAKRDAEVAAKVHRSLRASEKRLTDLALLAQREGTLTREVDAAVLARLMLYISVGMDVLAALDVQNPEPAAWSSSMRRLFAGLSDEDPGTP